MNPAPHLPPPLPSPPTQHPLHLTSERERNKNNPSYCNLRAIEQVTAAVGFQMTLSLQTLSRSYSTEC
ncbi:hypothetical protein chiPu_0002500 [Chiloscyllium punctatum]|uniref:Uncharacterized protein n=1 Tax=Chiloscyllium punctatum TaxID=137246 RepID=A0A401S177_CHIPU|nr:hypothetical protein [Chiloscyllium punctatum]